MAISAQFTADFTQYTAAAAGAQAALEGVKGAADGVDVDKQAAAAGRAMMDLGGKVKDFATEYLTAFAEEEAATQRLTSALQASGNATPAVIAQYQAMAEQFQRTTRYSDDAVIAAQTALTQIGRIGPEQMQPAIQAAADLAARLGIGLEEAATKLATVIGSDGAKLGTLKKYLTDVDLKGKDAAAILGIINSKFGGAAAADMATMAAKLEAFNNQLGDVKDKGGGVIASVLTPLLDMFLKLPEPVQNVGAAIGVIGASLVPVVTSFGLLVTAIGPLVPMIGTALAGAFTAIAGILTGPVIAAIAAVAGAVIGLYYTWKNWDKIVDIAKYVYEGVKMWLVDKFTVMVDMIMAPIKAVAGAYQWLYDKVVGHSIVPDMMKGIGAEFGKLNDLMVKPADAAASGVITAFNRMAHNFMLIETDAGGVAHDAYGRPVVPGGAISALPSSLGQQNIQITINGSVLSTQDQIAAAVGSAVTGSYSRGGQRMPV